MNILRTAFIKTAYWSILILMTLFQAWAVCTSLFTVLFNNVSVNLEYNKDFSRNKNSRQEKFFLSNDLSCELHNFNISYDKTLKFKVF